MKFNDLRVAHKLWGVILGLLLLMFVAALWTQVRTRQTTDEIERMVQQSEESITTAVSWRGLAEVAVTMAMASLVTTDDVLRKDFDDRVNALTARITPVQEKINKTARTQADKDALAYVAKTRAELRGTGDQVRALKASGDAAAKQAFHDKEYRPRVEAYLVAIDKYVAVQREQLEAARQAAVTTRNQVQLLAIISAVVVFVLSIALALMLVRSITQPLARAVAVAEAIATGDLTQQLQDERRDEFGELTRSLSGMTGKLRSLVSEVRSGVESVSTASTEIANGNHDLSIRTEQTASNLQQTASSTAELSSTVNQAADTARQANELATQAAQVATRGGAGGGAGGQQHAAHHRFLAQDRRHHWHHRRHCLPDQHPGAERRGGGGTCGRAGPWICRGGRRSAQSGPALRRGGQGNQGTHQHVGADRRVRFAAGGTSGPDHGRDRQQRQTGDRPDRRDHRFLHRAA